ncbi:hypothetical protein LCGC14_2885720 [marine sediment metagenome]|uniref:Uncharacterized protein n=1 Tax=marine sediment metagenome TaxID=412755 RepID=A0A0F8XYZ4_9ZZZZ
MQIARAHSHFRAPVTLVGLGQSPAADRVVKAVEFANRARTDVIDPTLAKSATQFLSPIGELRDELRRVCGTGVGEDVEVGKFLQVLDCWVTEAFGWWAQTEQIALQTVGVGNAMLGAANKAAEGRASVQQFAFIAQMTTTGLNFLSMGNILLTQAVTWKPVLRNVLAVSHSLRDVVLIFNDSVDQGILPDDTRTEQLRVSLETTVEAWKREIINRVVDAAFATRQFALGLAEKNTQIIAAGFELAGLTPELLAVISELVLRVQQLAELLDFAALPGRALAGLGGMVGDAAKAVAGGAVNVVFDIALKAALVAGGVAIVATGIAVVLKKTGVIGKVNFRRRGG